jgi:hypothetical protein
MLGGVTIETRQIIIQDRYINRWIWQKSRLQRQKPSSGHLEEWDQPGFQLNQPNTHKIGVGTNPPATCIPTGNIMGDMFSYQYMLIAAKKFTNWIYHILFNHLSMKEMLLFPSFHYSNWFLKAYIYAYSSPYTCVVISVGKVFRLGVE